LAQVVTAAADRHLARRRVGRGLWIPEGNRGLYRLRDAPQTWPQQLWLAVLEPGCPAVLSHRIAAKVLGFSHYQRELADIEIQIKRGRHHRVRLSRLHETSWLPPEHVMIIDPGLPPVATPARCVFDLAGEPDDLNSFRNPRLRTAHEMRMAAVCNDALAHRGMKLPDLVAVAAALCRRGRPGSAIIRAILDDFGENYTPTESDLETAFVALCRSFGIEEPERQQQFDIQIAGIVRVDFLYARAKVVVEIDGRWHDSPLQRRADRWRDNEFAALGYRVIRFRWVDLRNDPERVARILRAAIAVSA
jgi:very-short-patch-repair endonuclease